MEQISKLVKKRANIILQGFDPLSAGGFTQVPNILLKNKKLSIMSKFVYAMLLSYAWNKDKCFPGQNRLADDIGVHLMTVNRAIKELEKSGYLKIKRMGLGKPNIYTLFCRIKKAK